MNARPVLVAASLAAALLLPVSPAQAADPEPVPCSPGSCEPAPPCDPQAAVNMGLALHRAESRVARLEVRVERREDLIAKLRRKLARERGWQVVG